MIKVLCFVFSLLISVNSWSLVKQDSLNGLPLIEISVSFMELEKGQTEKELCQIQLDQVLAELEKQEIPVLKVYDCNDKTNLVGKALGINLQKAYVVTIPSDEEFNSLIHVYEEKKRN